MIFDLFGCRVNAYIIVDSGSFGVVIVAMLGVVMIGVIEVMILEHLLKRYILDILPKCSLMINLKITKSPVVT